MRNYRFKSILLISILATLIYSCSNEPETPSILDSIIPPDTSSPQIISFSPTPGDTWVSARGPITVRFSEDIDETSVDPSTFIITPKVYSAREVCRTEMACTAWSYLDWATTYTVTVTEDISDTLGNTLKEGLTWSFTTRTEPPPPVITSVDPSNAPIYSPVTIYGTGFDTIRWNNEVWFGEESAFIIRTNDTSIETIVPATATTGPIIVENLSSVDTSDFNFVIPAVPDSFIGAADGTFKIIRNFNTSQADTLSQWITVYFHPSTVYTIHMDYSKQTEDQRVFCDFGGSFNFKPNGILLDVDDPNFTSKDCDTTLSPDAFFGATYRADTLYMINYNYATMLVRELKLIFR